MVRIWAIQQLLSSRCAQKLAFCNGHLIVKFKICLLQHLCYPKLSYFQKVCHNPNEFPFQLYFQGFLNPKPDLLSALGSNSPELFGFCSQSHQCLCRERTGVKFERILPEVKCQKIFYNNIAQNFFKKIVTRGKPFLCVIHLVHLPRADVFPHRPPILESETLTS